MFHRMVRLALACVLILLVTGAGAAQDRLNLFIWSEYISPEIIATFENRFRCKVSIDLYEDAESMLAKLQAGGTSLYDVVVPPDHIVPAMIGLKLLAPLRHENIPNLKNIEKQFISPSYDTGNKYTVAYQWGTVGIFARKTGEAPIPDTWGAFFDPKLQQGPFVLIDSMRDMLGAALKYRGFSINSTDPKELKIARDLVLDAKKRSAGFDGSVGARNKVLARAARYAIVYSGEGLRGMLEDADTVYFIPKEGSQIWVDNLAVPAKAPHRDLAESFINYTLDPKVGAQISSYTRFSSPNRAARAFIRAEDLNNPRMYPSAEVRAKLEFLKDLGGKTRYHDEIWTQVKGR